jgi:hypothetical protein
MRQGELAEAALESVPGGVPGDLLRNRSTLYSKVAEFREDSEYALVSSSE